MKFFDLARMTVASTGTGNITLGTAVTGLLTFDLAGCSTTSSGQVIRYAINDNTNSEIGQATYISSSLLLSGRAPEASTNGGATIGVSNAAQVFITPSAADWQTYTGVVVWSSAMALTSSEAVQASNNISAVSYSTAQTLGSSQFAPTLSNLTAVSYSSQATALSTTQQAQARSNLGLGWTPIATVDFSTPVAAVDVVLPAGIKFTRFSGWIDCGTTQGLGVQTSVDGGATFAAAGADYLFSVYDNNNGTMNPGIPTSFSALVLSGVQEVTNVPVSVFGTLTTGSTSYLPWLNGSWIAYSAVAPVYGQAVGGRAATATINAIRILGTAGANMLAGHMLIEGA